MTGFILQGFERKETEFATLPLRIAQKCKIQEKKTRALTVIRMDYVSISL
jgi:hypothetical protein